MRTAALAGVLLATVLAGCGSGGGDAADFGTWKGHELRSMTAGRVEELESGGGDAYGLAALRNGYPGPAEALALAGKLGLDGAQVAQLERIRDDTQRAAANVGSQLLDAHARLEELFRGGTAGASAIQRATGDIGVLEGRLLSIHLGAHAEAFAVLTPQQQAAYAAMQA